MTLIAIRSHDVIPREQPAEVDYKDMRVLAVSVRFRSCLRFEIFLFSRLARECEDSLQHWRIGCES